MKYPIGTVFRLKDETGYYYRKVVSYHGCDYNINFLHNTAAVFTWSEDAIERGFNSGYWKIAHEFQVEQAIKEWLTA